jgi:hypothetical protein
VKAGTTLYWWQIKPNNQTKISVYDTILLVKISFRIEKGIKSKKLLFAPLFRNYIVILTEKTYFFSRARLLRSTAAPVAIAPLLPIKLKITARSLKKN